MQPPVKVSSHRRIMCPYIIGICTSQSSAYQLLKRRSFHRSMHTIKNAPFSKRGCRRLTMIDDDLFLPPTLERIKNKLSARSKTTQQSSSSFLVGGLATSHLGLDPSKNLRHAPIVYHENYSFDNWPRTHTFPMDKFRMTAHSILNDPDEDMKPLVKSAKDFYEPLSFHDFPTSILSPPIDSSFLESFLNGKL